MANVFFSGPAITEFHPTMDDKDWYFSIHKQFIVQWKGRTLIVPKGFETDLASIPQPLQSFIPLIGNHLQAAIVHDLGYRTQIGFNKKDMDDMFYDAMRQLGVGWFKAQMMYQSVSLFGGSSFKGG